MGFRAQPVTIPARGTVPSIVVGLPMETGDALVIGNITITTSDASLTVDNEAVNVSPVTINGTTYAAGQAVEFDLISANDATLAASSEYVRFAYTAPSGYEATVDLQVAVVVAAQADYTSEPAVSADGATFYLGTRLWELLGVAENAPDLGVLTQRDEDYPTVPDNSSFEEAIQELLTAHEADEWLNVVDYGADPTGVADSAAAIQAAIDAALPAAVTISTTTGSSINRRYGSVVFFPKGKYLIQSPLTVPGSGMPVTWIGENAILIQGGSFPTGRWMVELGEHGSITLAPMFVYVRGMIFSQFTNGVRVGGVDNNVNLGKMYFENCDFIGRTENDGFGVRVFNRSAGLTFSNCQWDNCLISLEVQSCDLVYLNECRMQIKRFEKLSTARREDVHGYFVLRRGQLHVRNFIANTPNPAAWAAGGTYAVGNIRKVDSTDDSPDKGSRWYACTTAHTAGGGQAFDEAYIATNWELCESASNPLGWFKAEDFPAWAGSTAYIVGDIIIYSGTKYRCNTAHTSTGTWGDHSAKFTALIADTLSVWSDITIDDTLFGGEGGGITPVIWNIAPDTAAAAQQYQKALVIRNSQIGNDLQGYGDEGYAVACLFCHRPNNFVFTNNRFSYTYCLPADYWVDAAMPTWPPTSSASASQLTPCDVTIYGNNGSAFRGVTELADAKWPYGPNWIPYDIQVPTLYLNDAGPQLPGDHRAFKVVNSSSTTITRFLGAQPGKVFTVYVKDTNTTISNGNYIKLAGGTSFAPGAAGGCITFVVIDDPTYQSVCIELSRATYT